MLLYGRCHCKHSFAAHRCAPDSVIWLLPSTASSTPLLLINHLLMHLLSLELFLARDRILELLDVLVQKLLLGLLLVLCMVALVCDLLHDRIDLFRRRFEIWEAAWLLIHLTWGAGVAKVSLRCWHRLLLDVWWKIADSVPIGTRGVISRCTPKTALRHHIQLTVDLLRWWWWSQYYLCYWVILRSLSFCACSLVFNFWWRHSQKRRRHRLLWLLTIRYLLCGSCSCRNLIRIRYQISDVFNKIVVFLPLPVILRQLLLHLSTRWFFLLGLSFIVWGLRNIVFISFWLHWLDGLSGINIYNLF